MNNLPLSLTYVRINCCCTVNVVRSMKRKEFKPYVTYFCLRKLRIQFAKSKKKSFSFCWWERQFCLSFFLLHISIYLCWAKYYSFLFIHPHTLVCLEMKMSFECLSIQFQFISHFISVVRIKLKFTRYSISITKVSYNCHLCAQNLQIPLNY